MGKNTDKPLTHEEIWDDSALVRSWDEAVQEYRVYTFVFVSSHSYLSRDLQSWTGILKCSNPALSQYPCKRRKC